MKLTTCSSRGACAILNAGHKAGGTVPRTILGEVVKYPVYAPVALAAIGTLPETIMSRALVIHMHRADPDVKLARFDKENEDRARDLDIAKSAASQRLDIAKSAASQRADQVQLDPDPDMPMNLGGRTADNWRVLIAIANLLNRGKIARDAAIKFLREYKSPNIKISLLRDIRAIFDMTNARILPSKVLMDKLLTLEDSEYDWSEQQLTQNKLSRMLNDFQIRPQNIWWPEHEHRSHQQNLRCYVRSDFESLWRRYTATTTTSTTTRKKDGRK